jgi:hypothetical protein
MEWRLFVDDQKEQTPNIINIWQDESLAKRLRPNRLSPSPLLRITDGMACRDAAAMLGINAGTLQKWRNGQIETGLHYAQADRIAIRKLGVHPATVWGSDWWRV